MKNHNSAQLHYRHQSHDKAPAGEAEALLVILVRLASPAGMEASVGAQAPWWLVIEMQEPKLAATSSLEGTCTEYSPFGECSEVLAIDLPPPSQQGSYWAPPHSKFLG
jgi:hypothetical protein